MLPFDLSLGRRTLGFTASMLAATLVVVMATDEPGSTFGMRLARMAALAPVLAGLGGALSLAQASSRGELRALQALGASPWRTGQSVMVCGWLVGGLALATLCLPVADVRALLPVLPPSASWVVDGRSFIEPRAGLRVITSGSFELLGHVAALPRPESPETAAPLFAFGPLALWVPPWVTAPLSPKSRLAIFVTAGSLTLVLLHLVAAGTLGVAWLVAPALPVAAHALWGHVAGGSRSVSSRSGSSHQAERTEG